MSRNPLDALPGNLGNSLGDYLREQRVTKKLSVRQLSALAGISNPYLSQIERGVKRPSAEILQQIAKGLSISAETLYVQAGLLDPQEASTTVGDATRAAIAADPLLTTRQRQALIDIYESFVEGGAAEPPKATSKKKTTATKSGAAKTPAKKATAKKAVSTQGASTKAPAKKAPAKKATKTTAPTKTSAASKKSSSSTSSKTTSAARGAARGTTTSSSTSTSRRSA